MKLIEPARVRGALPEDLEKKYLVAEEKKDGARYMLYLGFNPYEAEKNGNYLLSRRISVRDGRLVDKSENTPHLSLPAYESLKGTIIDGEIVAENFDSTTMVMGSSPEMARLKQEKNGWAKFYVFDIPLHRGIDIREKPLSERRKILEQVVQEMNNPHIEVIPQVQNDIMGYFKKIIEAEGEGLVVKDVRAAYGKHWAKMKGRKS